MSLNRTLRTIESVAREVERAAAATDRDLSGMQKQLDALDAKLVSKPISTLGLTFNPTNGLHADELKITSGSAWFSVGPLDMPAPANEFVPPSHEENGVKVEPLGLYTSPWCIMVPIRVSNSNPDLRPKLNWVKKTDRSSSSIFLIDVVNSEYYYPLETDFTGEILSGHPRVGLFAFDKFRSPTDHLELHLSGVKLSDIGPNSFHFSLRADDLPGQIEEGLAAQPLAERFRAAAKEQKLAQESAAGCSVVALLLGAGTIAAAALAAGLV